MNQKLESGQSSIDNAERIIELFRSIHKAFKDQMIEKSKKYGLTGPQLGLVFALKKCPNITLNELSEHLGLSKSTVSGIVDRLVAQGVVIREIPSDNRRIVKLSLSPEFMKNHDLIDLKKKYVTETIKSADQKDIDDIILGLEKMYKLIK